MTSSAALLKITVQKSEVPAGYQPKPDQEDASDDGEQAALVRCIGSGTDTSKDRTGAAHSPDYTLQNTQISSQAESFRTRKDVEVDAALLSSPNASKCYAKMFTAQLASTLPSGTTASEVDLKIFPHSAGEPSNVVGTGVGAIILKANGETITLYIASAFMSSSLIESEVDIINVGAPIPPSLLAGLVKKVASRTAAA